METRTIGIFPLFLSDGDSVWNLATAAPLMENFISQVVSPSLFDAFWVVSNHPGAESLVPGGCGFVLAPEADDGPQELLPSDIMAALEAVQDAIGPGDRIVVLDKAYPLMDGNLLETALESFERSARDVLFPVTECEYHPCTLRTRLNLLENGLVPVLGAPDGAGLRRSASFPWRWPADMDAAMGQALEFVFFPDSGRCGFRPVEDGRGVDVAFVYEGRDTASLLVARSAWKTEDVLGVAVAASPGGGRATLSAQDGEVRLSIPSMPGAGAGETLCHLFAQDHAAEGPKQLHEYSCEEGGLPVVLPESICGRQLYGYQAYAVADKGTVDLGVPFPPDAELWTVSQRGLLVSLPEGTVIHGRQAFPEVYERCPAFVILRGEVLRARERLHDLGNAASCMMDRTRLFRVDSPLDLLKLNVSLKHRESWLS